VRDGLAASRSSLKSTFVSQNLPDYSDNYFDARVARVPLNVVGCMSAAAV
jgi:hypothetical protein